MAEAIILQANTRNAYSEEMSAVKANVLSGKTYCGNDSDDDIVTGTMPNNGAISRTLNCGQSYTIPVGYHNGSGKVTVNSLASQTSATAAANSIRKGKVAWVNGKKITGTASSY